MLLLLRLPPPPHVLALAQSEGLLLRIPMEEQPHVRSPLAITRPNAKIDATSATATRNWPNQSDRCSSPDGEYFAVCASDFKVRLFRWASGKCEILPAPGDRQLTDLIAGSKF